jgi:hypothetical protein
MPQMWVVEVMADFMEFRVSCDAEAGYCPKIKASLSPEFIVAECFTRHLV